MITLISNEFKKVGIFKLSISYIVFLVIIIIIYEFTDNMYNTIYNLIPFVGIMTSILFSGIISNEIEYGTIRFYLTKPISRKRIYQSKLLTIIIYVLSLLGIIYFAYYVLYEEIDKMHLIKYLKYSSSLLLISCLIILLSTIFRNTSLTVGISIFVLTFSLLITQILLDLKMGYIDFTFLPYMDFTLFDDIETINIMNKTYKINLSIKNGVILNIMYSYLFYIIGNNLFIKKDIRN